MVRHANLHSITHTLTPVVYSLLILFFIWPVSGAIAGSATLACDFPTIQYFLIPLLIARGIKPIVFNLKHIQDTFHEHYRIDRRGDNKHCPDRVKERRGTCSMLPVTFITRRRCAVYFKIYLFLSFLVFAFSIRHNW